MRSDDFIYFWFPHMRVLIRTRDKTVIYRNRGLRNSIEIAPTVDMLLCISTGSTIDEPARSGDTEALVAAHDRALAALSRDIARALPAARPAALP